MPHSFVTGIVPWLNYPGTLFKQLIKYTTLPPQHKLITALVMSCFEPQLIPT